jgi:hypothetical protein
LLELLTTSFPRTCAAVNWSRRAMGALSEAERPQ